MTSPEQSDVSIHDFVRQVEIAFSDLPDPVRKRLMANLDEHLRELGQGNLLSALGEPATYARDLRAAMDLPAPLPAHVSRTWRRLFLLVVAFVAAVGLVVVAILLLSTEHRANSPRPAVSNTETISPTTVAQTITLPDLVGKVETVAIAEVENLGLQVTVQREIAKQIPVGVVAAQIPAAGDRVAAGATVTLRVSTGP